MKKIALVLTGAFLSVSTMGAMAYTSDNVVIESNFDGKKSKVEKEELPEEVIQSLEESEYQNWEITEAYKVNDEMTNEVHYELHLSSAADAEMVKSIKVSEAGEIIADEDSESGRTEDQEFEQEGEFERSEQPGLEGTEEESELEGTKGIEEDSELEGIEEESEFEGIQDESELEGTQGSDTEVEEVEPEIQDQENDVQQY